MIQTFEMLDKEKLTDEISPTKTGHEDTKRTQLTFDILATKHNTLNGKFTDFDHSKNPFGRNSRSKFKIYSFW